MRNDTRILVMLLIIAAASASVSAHEGHNKNAANANTNTALVTEQQASGNTAGQPVSTPAFIPEKAPMVHNTEFPTLHPLVVHFPIMLILLAAIVQLVSLFVFRREMSWAVIFLTAFGALGAYLSSGVFHPHTSGLSENAQRLLEEHELYADWTLWLAVAGLAFKIVSNFLLELRWWSEVIVSVTLIVAAVAVSIAGHHGAELVHKEGVGPQGKFLEMHDH